MASLTLTFPDAIAQRVLNSFCTIRGYSDTVPNPEDPGGPWIPNPETKAQFAKRQLKEFVLQELTRYEVGVAVAAASTAAGEAVEEDIRNNVIIT